MNEHTFQRIMKRLLVFVFAVFLSHAFACAQGLELHIMPDFVPFTEGDLKAAQNAFSQKADVKDLFAKLQLSWKMIILKDGKTTKTFTFTPYQKLREFLQTPSSSPPDLSASYEALQSFKLGEGWIADIAWDGKVRLSNNAKKGASTLSVYTSGDVILGDISPVSKLSITAASVAAVGTALIHQLEVVPVPKIALTFELKSTADVTIHTCDIKGAFINKGTFRIGTTLNAESIVNAGTFNVGDPKSSTKKQTTVCAKGLFLNSYVIQGENLSVKANLFCQSDKGGYSPSLLASTLKVQANESLDLASGFVGSHKMTLISLGNLINRGYICSRELSLISQGTLSNFGRLEGLFSKFDTYGTVLNQGRIQASHLDLDLHSTREFWQKGEFQVFEVSLSGENGRFVNQGDLDIRELTLCKGIDFENQVPPTQDASSPTTSKIACIRSHSHKGTLKNFGSLSIDKGELDKVQNQGCLVSKELHVKCFKQAGEANLTVLEVQEEGTNTGTLTLSFLNGAGTFQQSGVLQAAGTDKTMEITTERFCQESDGDSEPSLLASRALITGTTVKNGEKCHMVVRDLMITNAADTEKPRQRRSKNKPYVFENQGFVKTKRLNLSKRDILNKGTLSALFFSGSGKLENEGTIGAKKASLRLTSLVQNGTFYAEELTGDIDVWDEKAQSAFTNVAPEKVLKIAQVNLSKGSVWETGGTITGTDWLIAPEAKMIVQNGKLALRKFKNESHLLLDNTFVRSSTYDAGPDSVTDCLNGSDIWADVADRQGVTRSPGDLCMSVGKAASNWGRLEFNGNFQLTVPEGISLVGREHNLQKIDVDSFDHRIVKIKVIPKEVTFQFAFAYEGKMEIEAHSLNNEGLLLADDLEIKTTGTLKNTELISGRKGISIRAGSLSNEKDGQIISCKNMQIQTKTKVGNTGFIYGIGELFIETKTVSNQGKGQIVAKEDLKIVAQDVISNSASHQFPFRSCLRGFARILSQTGCITLQAREIQNNLATLQAGTVFDMKASSIKNIGGLIYAQGSAPSRFSAEKLIDSCKWCREDEIDPDDLGVNTFLIYCMSGCHSESYASAFLRAHDRVPLSGPGTIFIGGDCILDVKSYAIEGGVFVAKGSIQNAERRRITLKASAVGWCESKIQADTIHLETFNARSRGGQFLVGKGGLNIRSQKNISIASSNSNEWNNERFPASTKELLIGFNIPSFGYRPDGTIILRSPEADPSSFKLDSIVTDKPLDPKKPIQFMMTPLAFMRALELDPFLTLGLSSEAALLKFCENSLELSKGKILAVKNKKETVFDKPVLIFEVEEQAGVKKLSPFIPSFRAPISAPGGIYSLGPVYLEAKDVISFDQAVVCTQENLLIRSQKNVQQEGGAFVSRKAIVIEAPKISLKTKMQGWDFWEGAQETHAETIVSFPTLATNSLELKGNVRAVGLQAKAQKLDHSGGKLRIEGATTTRTTHSTFKDGNESGSFRTYQESAVPSQLEIGVANLHSDTHLEGVKARFGELHRGGALTLAAQILDEEYEGHAEKSGFFRSSSMHTSGFHQQALPSRLKVGLLNDLEKVGGPLVLRSSMLNFVAAQTRSEIREETSYLEHMDHTETKVSGLSLPWFSDPRPSLQKSLQALGEASSTAGRSVAALQTVTNALRLMGDAAHWVHNEGTAVPNILLGAVSKLATLSIGVREESQTVTRSEPVPNKVKGEAWTVQNKKTHLEGQHEVRKLNLKTKKLTATAPVEEVHQKATSTSTEVSFSPVQAATSGPAGLLPTVSHSETKTESHDRKVHPTQIKADEAHIKVQKNAQLKGTRIKARKAKVHVNENLTVESTPDTHRENRHSSGFSVSMNAVAGVGQALGKTGKAVAQAGNKFSQVLDSAKKSPLSAVPTYQTESHKNVQQKVGDRAGIVADTLDLTVGETLKKRSADVQGTRSSRIKAQRVETREVPSFSKTEDHSFVVPVADLLALGGAVNDLVIVRRQAFEALQEQGLTDSEAVSVLEDPVVEDQLTKMAGRRGKLIQEALETQDHFEKAKEEAARPIRQTEDVLEESDPRSLAYQILLKQEEAAAETFAEKAVAEYQEEIQEINRMTATSHPKIVSECLRGAARQKLIDAIVIWSYRWVPLYGTFHDLLEGKFKSALKSGVVDTAWMLLPFGKIAQTTSTSVQTIARPITQALEKQAQRFGAKIVASKKLTGLFKEPDIMARGMRYENYVAGELSGRLKPGHPVFDFFDRKTRHAVSVKSMDTQTAARLADPSQVYKTLHGNINKTINYTGKGGTFLPDEILSRELRVGIPLETNQAQWQQILRAIEYGKSNGVRVVVEALK